MCIRNVFILQTTSKFTPKPEESYAWQPSSVNSTGPESQPTSAFSYTPASPSHQPVSPASTHRMHEPHTDSSTHAHMFTSSSSLPPLVDGTTSLQRQRTISQSSTSSQPAQNGTDHHVSKSMLHLKEEPSRLPPSQSPFITLLQKNRGKSSSLSLGLLCFIKTVPGLLVVFWVKLFHQIGFSIRLLFLSFWLLCDCMSVGPCIVRIYPALDFKLSNCASVKELQEFTM